MEKTGSELFQSITLSWNHDRTIKQKTKGETAQEKAKFLNRYVCSQSRRRKDVVMKKAWNIFQSAEVIAAFILALVIVAPMVVGIRPYIVTSGSMEPVIHTGSMAFVNTNADKNAMKKGDIITFMIGGKVVTHRVYQVNEDGTLRTKGDANRVKDLADINRSQIIGEEKYSIPYLGEFVLAMKSMNGIIAIAKIVSANALVSFIIRHSEKEKE